MKCDLCKRGEALKGHLLCVPCAEMVQRLIVVEKRLHDIEEAAEARTINLTAAAAGSLA